MKIFVVILLASFSCVLLAGCPDRSPNKPADGNVFSGGKPLEDEKYGTLTLLDKKRLGDRDVAVYANAWRVGDDKDIKDPVVRVYISGGEADKRVVRIWLTDSNGNKLTSQANGEWNKSGENFLCKPDLKEKSVKPGMYKLWVSVNDAEDSWDISVK